MHTRIGQIAGHRLFPYAFGNPHSLNITAESAAEPISKTLDLPDPITGGNHGENWFVEGTANNFEATILD